MENHNCPCSSMETLSMPIFARTQEFTKNRSNDHFGQRAVRAESIFASNGRIGYALAVNDGDEHWERAAVGIPNALGFFVVTIYFRNRQIDEQEGDLRLELETTLEFYDVQDNGQPVWEGEILITGNIYNLSSIRTTSTPSPTIYQVRVPDRIKKYDWKCLRKCAPGCATCLTSIECWAICAAACLVSCAFD